MDNLKTYQLIFNLETVEKMAGIFTDLKTYQLIFNFFEIYVSSGMSYI